MIKELQERQGAVPRALRAALALLWGAAVLLWAAAGPARAQLSESDVFVAQAILAYEAGRYDEALSLLKEALAQDPKNVEALYYTGLALMAQQKLEAAVEALEAARAQAPTDFSIRYLLGVAYFSLERYDRAEPLLTEVFNERPNTEGVGYYIGFMRYRRKDYHGALRAFRAETSSNPNIQQLAKFYAGLTLAILGLPEQAVEEVEAALKVQTASALTGPAERIRDSIVAARERERRFRAEVRVGVFHDSNTAVNPEPSHDPTAEELRRRKTRTTGELGSLRLDYSWLRIGPWESTVTYQFFQTYNNDLPSFNVQNHLGAAQLTYRGALAAMPYQLGGQYVYDYLTLDDREFVQRHSATLFGTLVESAGHLSTLQGRLQVKEFSLDSNVPPEEKRDAKNWMVGLAHVFRFAQDRHLLRLGYQFDVEDADGRNYRYLGHRVLVGAQYTLPWPLPWGGARLRYDFDLHLRNYTHANTILPVNNPGTRERYDLEQNHVFRVEQPLPLNLTLSAEFQRTVARSNLPVFSYERNVWALILTWQY
jgi:tetratricopeptide (TPR) repeat protein